MIGAPVQIPANMFEARNLADVIYGFAGMENREILHICNYKMNKQIAFLQFTVSGCGPLVPEV